VFRRGRTQARRYQELAACDLRGDPARKQSVLTLTSRETEVVHLVGRVV
jgi:hypothetical protein